MKQFAHTFFTLLLFAFAFGQSAYAQGQAESADKTLSPYFEVKSDDPRVDALPLKSTSAEVNIAGVIADVTVTQVYKNEGKSALEAIYVFPASTKAAVYGMKMQIGERTIIANIREKNQARAEYEQAKSEGKRTSLLEQSRPNVFQMNVANVMPGDQIQVILQYTELLVPEDGTYQFVYPTVVGPRYSETPVANASAEENFIVNPYKHAGELPDYDFDLKVNLEAGMPIQSVKSSSHKLKINHPGLNSAEIALDPAEKKGVNKDFVLDYRLAGGKIESGVLLYEHGDENFFLMMVQPPNRVTPEQIPPRDYVFIVDVSGSMFGFPLDVSKKLMRDLITGLRPIDKFNVMLFSGGYRTLSPTSVPATQENLEKAVNLIDNQYGGGGTEMLPAMKAALALPRVPGLSRSMVIVTDGYVSIEKEAIDLVRNSLNQSNFYAFGIGSSVNRYLIEGVAHAGMSEPLIILDETEAHDQAEKFREYIASPVLTQIKTQYNGFETYDVEPLTVPDVLAERPIIIHGKYKGTAKGSITLTGFAGNQPYEKTVDLSEFRPSRKNNALRYLWAREKIKMLDDFGNLTYNAGTEAEITALGLKYNLMTRYTSFVAVDIDPANKGKQPVTQKVALPMPENVSDYAVGADLSIEEVVEMGSKTEVKMARVEWNSLQILLPAASLKLLQSLEEGDPSDLILNCLGENFKGKFTLKLTISRSGKVLGIKILGLNANPETEKCLTAQIRNWKFKASEKNQSREIQIPIELK
ncbi:MAG: VWA domain-containing protein [Bacteroidia bacterium]|nr:VWA domain-containing protein [Bacteroidia bacterium]